MDLVLALAALVVAAVSLFLAYTFRQRVSEYEQQLGGVQAQMQGYSEQVDKAAGQASNQLDAARKELDAEDARLSEQENGTATQLRELGNSVRTTLEQHRVRLDLLQAADAPPYDDDWVRAVEHLRRDQDGLRSQLHAWLDSTIQLGGAGSPIALLPGLAGAQRPASSEILPPLYEALLRSVNADVAFRNRAGPLGFRYYLTWHHPDGHPAEHALGGLLTSLRSGDAAQLGHAEFGNLMAAMYAAGPSLIRLGPLVASHATDGSFRGVVLTPEEATEPDSGQLGSLDVVALIDMWAARLRLLDDARVVDLASWAGQY
jgi:hypothetical protein